jgi:hypothetical protein
LHNPVTESHDQFSARLDTEAKERMNPLLYCKLFEYDNIKHKKTHGIQMRYSQIYVGFESASLKETRNTYTTLFNTHIAHIQNTLDVLKQQHGDVRDYNDCMMLMPIVHDVKNNQHSFHIANELFATCTFLKELDKERFRLIREYMLDQTIQLCTEFINYANQIATLHIDKCRGIMFQHEHKRAQADDEESQANYEEVQSDDEDSRRKKTRFAVRAWYFKM